MGPARRLGNRQDISPNDHEADGLVQTQMPHRTSLAVMKTADALIIGLVLLQKQAQAVFSAETPLRNWVQAGLR